MNKFIGFSDIGNDTCIQTDNTQTSFQILDYNEKVKIPLKPSIVQNNLSIPLVHEHIRRKLDGFYQSNKIPHIIFHGASGTGKLTLVYDFIKKIYNGDKSKIKSNVMIVNCSHGKGIKFIREELKFFAKTNIQINSGVCFKTILLLNAHHLTIDAQSALRRCIELFSYNTRFFIIVENKNKLLNPILSRFCEIYVPEVVEDDKIVNLHQYGHRELEARISKEKMDYIEGISETLFLESETIGIMDIANDLYENGISCLDLVKWMEKAKTRWSDIDYYDMNMKFYCMKSEFRCEKLLLFYMLVEMHKKGLSI
jgi:hypothetical protein